MISVAICTRQRPVLLRNMLESCVNMAGDPRTDIEFIVVENGPKEQAESIVQDFAGRLDIRYAHVPETGLVHARNGAIEAFLDGEGDWMAFMDDDVMVDPQWLVEMLNVMQKYPTALAFAGRHQRLEQDGTVTQTYSIGPPPGAPDGLEVWNVSTANILYHRSVVDPDGYGIRFHPAFNLSGGEDTHFSLTMKQKGILIHWVEKAIVREYLHEERENIRARIVRGITMGNNQGRSAILRYGPVAGRLVSFWYALMFAINFLTYGLAAVIVYPFSKPAFQRLRSRSFKFLLSAIGRVRSLFLPSLPVYAEVAGR